MLRTIFVILSIVFLALGLMSLLNAILGFRASSGILWFNLVYAALNLLTAYGLFMEKSGLCRYWESTGSARSYSSRRVFIFPRVVLTS